MHLIFINIFCLKRVWVSLGISIGMLSLGSLPAAAESPPLCATKEEFVAMTEQVARGMMEASARFGSA